MMTRICSCVLALGCLSYFAASAPADEPAETPVKVSYHRDVRPIFQEHCHGCHQPAKQGGDYVMTSFEQLVKGGESEAAAIVPGHPEKSYLMDQIKRSGDEAAMPKDNPPLLQDQIDLIARWIKEGAENDQPMSTQARYDMDHPPEYKAMPVVTSLDFSPAGDLLAVSGYHEVVLHHADGSGIAARLVGLSERIESAVFSPDGKRLAVTGGSPGRMGEVQIWDVESKQLVVSLTVGYDTIYGASWSPDGTLVGFGCPDNTIRSIKADSGEQVLFNGAHDDWVLDTVFSVKGDHLISVSRDQSMKLINVPTQRFIDNVTSITPGALKGGLASVDRHPTKEEVLCGGADGVPKIYRIFREQARKIGDDFNLIRAFPAMPGRIFSVAFSRDGERIVAGSSLNNAGQVAVFNAADGKQISKFDVTDGGIYAVAFSPDAKIVAAAGFSGTVTLLNAETGEAIKQFTPAPLAP